MCNSTGPISQIVTNRANIAIVNKQKVACGLRLPDLNLTLACSKGQLGSRANTSESGAWSPSRVISGASDRPFLIECQVCSLSTKLQASTIFHIRSQFSATIQRVISVMSINSRHAAVTS